MGSKYIVFSNGRMEIPVVFPETMGHDDMARFINMVVVSAGFCYIDNDGKYSCNGKSDTLNVKARVVDTALLNIALNVDY